LGKGCHENLHIKVVCLRNYLNCEKGIKRRATEERYIKITSLTKTSEGRQGHLCNDYISSTFSTMYVFIEYPSLLLTRINNSKRFICLSPMVKALTLCG
jgi:hypothetical protein